MIPICKGNQRQSLNKEAPLLEASNLKMYHNVSNSSLFLADLIIFYDLKSLKFYDVKWKSRKFFQQKPMHMFTTNNLNDNTLTWSI